MLSPKKRSLERGNSVKILTIHKSKGLEYPICYFADLDHEFNTSELKDKFIVDKKYGLIVPSNLEEIDNSLLKEMFKYDFNREEVSEKIKEEILEHCRKNISKYAMPREIEFRTELPKTLVGKVAYRKLEEEEAAKYEQQKAEKQGNDNENK